MTIDLTILLLICGILHRISAQPLSFFQNCANFAPPAIVQGRKIYNSVTGEYMPIKGIAYYPRPNEGELTLTNSIDFFTDDFRDIWERDIEHFKDLGVNVVRLYAVAPGASHDTFMCALKSAGIYAIVGLAADCLGCAVTNDPAPECYPAELKTRGQFIINEFARYDNVLAFSAGNEVSLSATSTFVNGACQKQFIRDMRAFIRHCRNTIRHIPVGLAIADTERKEQATWYNCRSNAEDELENAEFVGINSYLHCDGTLGPDDKLLGFEALLSDFDSYEMTIPVMLTEFGCISESFPTLDNVYAQRNFLQVDILFTPEYRSEFVGGIVFEYSTEKLNSLALHPFEKYGEGNFGVGRFDPVDCDDIVTPCEYKKFPQFEVLANKYAAVDTSDEPNLQALASTGSGTVTTPACPSEFARLDSYKWPSAEVEDLQCSGRVYVECPSLEKKECTNLGIQFTDSFLTETPAPTPSNNTAVPLLRSVNNATNVTSTLTVSQTGAELTAAPITNESTMTSKTPSPTAVQPTGLPTIMATPKVTFPPTMETPLLTASPTSEGILALCPFLSLLLLLVAFV